MRVLVTGGAGYIGSHAAKALAQAGFEPVVYDNLSTGHAWAVKWGPLVEGDLANPAGLVRAMRDFDVGAVMHFAASAYVGESVLKPREYFENNVVNSLNLLGAMQDAGVNHVVFSSTCASYGLPRTPLIDEHHPQSPINPYGDSKLFVEKALQRYGEAYGLSWTALRYFNAAGADPGGELGEAHDPETHLIPLVMQAATGERPAVDVFGTDYPTHDGTAVRDYIHVADLARAHVLALRYLLEGGESGAFNLGTGRGHSVQEIVASVERVSGRAVPVRYAPRRPGDPPALVAAAAKAEALLGWQAQHTDIDEIIGSAWAWHLRRSAPGVPRLAHAAGLSGD